MANRYITKKFTDANGNVDYMVIDTTTNQPVPNERIRQAYFQAPAQRYKTIRQNGKPILVSKATGETVSKKEIRQLIRENQQLVKAQRQVQAQKYGIIPTIGKIAKPVSKALSDFSKIGVWSDESASLPYSERHKRRTILQVQRDKYNKKDEPAPTGIPIPTENQPIPVGGAVVSGGEQLKIKPSESEEVTPDPETPNKKKLSTKKPLKLTPYTRFEKAGRRQAAGKGSIAKNKALLKKRLRDKERQAAGR